MRDMLFLSHANPEDNVVTRWLALSLAREGYGVWSDITKLLGGERFWNDIEEAIRERTAKFLFVLSKSSNQRPSPRDELHLAQTVAKQFRLRDFVIPVWIDDLPTSGFNIELQNLNAVPFNRGWAAGFAHLLEKLEEGQVPRHDGFGPVAVASWWRQHLSVSAGLRPGPERLVSNCYPVEPLPLQFHELARAGIGAIDVAADLIYPAARHEQYLVSFAPSSDFAGRLGPNVWIVATKEVSLVRGAEASEPRPWSFAAERATVTQILKQAWGRMLQARGIPTFAFAGGAVAGFFPTGLVPDDRIKFAGYSGPTRRDVVGYSQRGGGRFWHFGFQAKPTLWPVLGYILKPHVLFSDDGRTPWDDADRMHRARRSFCKRWWNDRWRDLLAATVAWLADSNGLIRLPAGTDITVAMRAAPAGVDAPVGFDDPAMVEIGAVSDEPYDGDEIEELDDADA